MFLKVRRHALHSPIIMCIDANWGTLHEWLIKYIDLILIITYTCPEVSLIFVVTQHLIFLFFSTVLVWCMIVCSTFTLDYAEQTSNSNMLNSPGQTWQNMLISPSIEGTISYIVVFLIFSVFMDWKRKFNIIVIIITVVFL